MISCDAKSQSVSAVSRRLQNTCDCTYPTLAQVKSGSNPTKRTEAKPSTIHRHNIRHTNYCKAQQLAHKSSSTSLATISFRQMTLINFHSSNHNCALMLSDADYFFNIFFCTSRTSIIRPTEH